MSNLIEIPSEELLPETLRSVVESFILREGTDYGAEEVSLEARVGQIMRQLDKKEVVIVFNTEEESCYLLRKSDWLSS